MEELSLNNIERCLVLSTAHMPKPTPDFVEESLRVIEHEYGYIVFVYADLARPSDWWLEAIYKLAIDNKCTMINFDRDAEEIEGLETYEW